MGNLRYKIKCSNCKYEYWNSLITEESSCKYCSKIADSKLKDMIPLVDIIEEVPVLKLLAEYVQKENIEAYVVGGYVRDSLLKRASKDIDIVCVGSSGIALAEGFAKAIGRTSAVEFFPNFGTAHFIWEGVELEFVGARRESYDRGSRKPVVEDGTMADDQNRRDFTINAMAVSLNKANYGHLIDRFDGLSDLNMGIIRTPVDPDITFSDDPLRMFRAVRFASRYGFEIESKTKAAIIKNKERISILSMERIAGELNKMLSIDKPSKAFYLLDEVGLLESILPELTALKGVEVKDGVSHKDNFIHTLQVLDNAAEASSNLWFRWTALLHDIGKGPTKRFTHNKWTFQLHEDLGFDMVRTVFTRLKLPLDSKMEYVQLITKFHGTPKKLVDDGVTDSAVRRLCVNIGDHLDDLILFCQCDITTSFLDKKLMYIQRFNDLKVRTNFVKERDNLENFKIPVSGDEIMKLYSLKPGREIGIIKAAVKEAILEGTLLNDRTATLGFIETYILHLQHSKV